MTNDQNLVAAQAALNAFVASADGVYFSELPPEEQDSALVDLSRALQLLARTRGMSVGALEETTVNPRNPDVPVDLAIERQMRRGNPDRPRGA